MLYIDPRILTLAPKDLQGTSCSACERFAKSGAKWQFFPGGLEASVLFCSACFLEGWAYKHKEEFASYLDKLETRIGRPIKWETDTRLETEDADRILAAIVVTSRIKYQKCPP